MKYSTQTEGRRKQRKGSKWRKDRAGHVIHPVQGDTLQQKNLHKNNAERGDCCKTETVEYPKSLYCMYTCNIFIIQ